MPPKKDSPHRRRSLGFASHSKPASKGKRRAYSIVPGDLSPLAKARRSLVPRKSILKTTTISAAASTPESQNASQVGSQNESNSQIDDGTMSMDLTTAIHDNPSRKSFGRRVSFANHAQVRLFQKPDNNNTNSTTSPQSSPAQPSPDSESKHVNDENAYPGASTSRPKSSVRFSMAPTDGEDMDLTMSGPTAIAVTGSAIVDEDEYYGDGDEETENDMDVTQVIRADLRRRSSVARPPLAQLQISPQDGEDPNQSQSYIEEDSQVYSEGGDTEPSQAMEFTIPLNQSLRPPAHEDEAWLALRRMTHSGDVSYDPEQDEAGGDQNGGEMELDDAVQRLLRARQSMTSMQAAEQAFQDQDPDDTFNSNASFGDDGIDDGDKTMNMSKVLGRFSLSGGLRDERMSLGGQDMDESEIYGTIVQANANPEPQPLESQSAAAPKEPSVSQPPAPEDTPVAPAATPPEPTPTTPTLVFVPPPVSAATPTTKPAEPTSAVATPKPSGLPKLSVFRPPSPAKEPKGGQKSTATPSPQKPRPPFKAGIKAPFTFTHQPVFSKPNPTPQKSPQKSPAKPTPKKTFTAAFAPPVPRPLPKGSSAKNAPSTSPAKATQSSSNKRQRSEDPEEGKPAKRLAFADRDDAGPVPAPAPQTELSQPAPTESTTTSTEPTTADDPQSQSAKPSEGPARRLSGYYARRKSLGTGLPKPATPDAEDTGPLPVNDDPPPSELPPPPSSDQDFLQTPVFQRRASAQPLEDVTGDVAEEDSEALAQARATDRLISVQPTRLSTIAEESMLDPTMSAIVDEDMLPPPPESDFVGEEDMDEEMDVPNPTEVWRNNVDNDAVPEEEDSDAPLISIDQFFQMTGIKFMDEIAAPRKSIHPSQLSAKQPRASEDIPLDEFFLAISIDIPQLVLYSRVSKDLQAWMQQSKAVFAQAEDEATKVTPELFAEYWRADEEGKAELLHQLNLIRTNTRGLAKSDWYDWKYQWVEGLRSTADKALSALQEDAKVLRGLNTNVDAILPSLQQEYDEVMRELEEEQAQIAEIEQSDQGYLAELQETIAEQQLAIDAFQSDVAEGKSQLRWLQERLQEIENQKAEAKDAVESGQRILNIQQNSTRAEVFRLKEELEALEDFHMTQVLKVSSNMFEYIYASKYHISIPCRDYNPIPGKVSITQSQQSKKYRDDFPQLNEFWLRNASQALSGIDKPTIRQVVQSLAAYWSSCTQLRTQLRYLSVRVPLEFKFPQPNVSSDFRVEATVMYKKKRAKALITFIFPFALYSQWPISVKLLNCDVQIVYGQLDGEVVRKVVKDRLSDATPRNNFACLLDSCMDAQALDDD